MIACPKDIREAKLFVLRRSSVFCVWLAGCTASASALLASPLVFLADKSACLADQLDAMATRLSKDKE